MEELKLNQEDEMKYVSLLKGHIRDFIMRVSGSIINEDQKTLLIRELGYNFVDHRFILEEALGVIVTEAQDRWIERNLGEVELWKSVAIESSKSTLNPEEVADGVLCRFKENFKTKDDESQ